MMRFSATVGAVTMTAALFLAGVSTPALSASSKTTDAYLAAVNPNVDFLDRSSRMALDNSKSARLKAFAFSEAKEQTLTANDLDDWIKADLAPVVADGSKAGTGEVMTGRSVAIDAPSTQVAGNFPPASQEDLDNLYGLTGGEFDDLYKSKQLDALGQLAILYKGYVDTGDDAALKAMAVKELPKINHRIAELRHL